MASPWKGNMVGLGGQLYAEPKPSPAETSFKVDNTSGDYYNSPYYLAHKSQVQPIPPPRRNVPPYLRLTDFISAEVAAAIQSSGKISFHAVGDTGAAKVNRTQTAATAIGHEGAIAEAIVADVQSGGLGGPAFFFHLGDVVYNFGEAQYYYDQFYEPFREYDRPIFAIPGNHDGMVFGQGSSAPQIPTLEAFLANFCAAMPGPSPDSGGLSRSAMTQPGVYFTLDAPFVSVIGLYSNVLDTGAGVISSQQGHFPLVDDQLAFLQSELKRLKPQRQAGQRAVLIAVHHPPLSVDAKHGGTTGLEQDIDSCCAAAGLWPDAVLSGHAHLYQRFTRVVNGRQIPYVVSGSGGFAATRPQGNLPSTPLTIGDATLEIDPIVEFGYLILTTDAKTLSITFKTAGGNGVATRDAVTVDLAKGKISSAGGPSGANAPAVGKNGKAHQAGPRKRPQPKNAMQKNG